MKKMTSLAPRPDTLRPLKIRPLSTRLQINHLFTVKNDFLRAQFEEVTPYAFYRDMFPEGSLEQRGYVGERRPNAIYTEISYNGKKKRYAHSFLLFDDLEDLERIQGAQFVISSPVTYRGKQRTAKNAHHLWGIAIDLDDVGVPQLEDLLHQISIDLLPEPTYIVNSGHGVHLYYLLEYPIPLYPWVHKSVARLKHGLTDIVWNNYTSQNPKKQFQGIFQGFRMPGTQTKLGENLIVTAFKVGTKHTLKYLSDFVDEEYKFDAIDELNHLTLEEARTLYPDWYERRIVKEEPKRGYTCNKGLYDWWKGKIKEGAFDGNRYNCVSILMVYAVKCDIPKKQAIEDALEMLPWLNSLTVHPENQFTEQDVWDASEYYDEVDPYRYKTMTVKTISAKTGIKIERCRRNHLEQDVHLELARDRKKTLKRLGKLKNPEGRPPKQSDVMDYLKANPGVTNVSEIARQCGVSRNTVYKYLKMMNPAEN